MSNRQSRAAEKSQADDHWGTLRDLGFADRGRLLFVIDSLGRGGAERLMVPYLTHMAANGFAVRACALGVRDGNPIGAELERRGIPVDLVPVRRLARVDQALRLAAYLRRQRPGLVHTQLEAANIIGTAVARLLRIPTVTTLHTLDEPPPGSRTARRIALERAVLGRWCDRIVCVSDEVRRHETALMPEGRARLVTLMNGIELSSFHPPRPGQRAAARAALGLPENAPVAITVAVLRRENVIHHMIQAMPDILARVPEARYAVVGDGAHRADLERLAADPRVAGRVLFTGHRTDIPDLLAAADLFVLPTLGDALPTVLAEAMATTLPIVASAVGGIPEMVEDGANALLVPPGDPARLADACATLLGDPARARALGDAGRRIAEARFDLDTQANRLAALYDDLIRCHRS